MAKTFSRKKLCNVGDRIVTPTNHWGTISDIKPKGVFPYQITWDNGPSESYSAANFEQYNYKICSQTSEPVDSSRESAGFPKQLSLLEGLIGSYQSNNPPAPAMSYAQTSIIQSGKGTSEDFIQVKENTISSLEDSPAQTHQEPETELESLTPLQNQAQCSVSSSESLESVDPNSSFWSSLPDLSIEDLERGLADSDWEDIKASIQSSRALINLGRSLKGKESLSFPTLLAGQGKKHRDAGETECERWFKKSGIVPTGSQLSSSAIASLHGFPANWFRSISPPLAVTPATPAGSQPESLEVKPLPLPRQELPSNSPSGCGNNFSREWLVGDRVELIEEKEFNSRRLGDTGTVTEVKANGGTPRIVVTWDKKRSKLSSWTAFLAETTKLKLVESSAAAHQSTADPLGKLKSEEELTPTDTSAVGRHYWCDRLTVAVEVLKIRNWREKPRGEIVLGANCRPWWQWENGKYLFPDVMVCTLQELVEIEKFSCAWSPPDQPDSLEKSSKQTGSLYQYTANRRGKDGVMREYPIVEGRDRDRAIDDDWYWGISYVEKVRGKWRDKSSSIPRWSLSLARQLMREKFPVELTISAAQVKWLWTTEIGEYLIGETKPEACPRLAILSFGNKELFISGPSWGEALPLWRQQRREEIEKAIRDCKPFSYIKEHFLSW